ncbi:unnamed protein product [Parascedosporium putredinis]|uniref:AA1-like domain-containing protein n=1 Tax=Parascedosporium putredinis TaxID=1442378 RepID=A0A9P1H1E1_9PEZI|nr:unnamed protein product [Parascedosporium putredinis]CAI7993654.1 unnamed protein product [Parascedosporium putredinis]
MNIVAIASTWATLALLASAQSPGPDWPRCAATSETHHAGWEIIDLIFTPPDPSYDDSASLYLLVRNIADGSRTDCQLKHDSVMGEGGSSDTTMDIVLTNMQGTCLTYWAESSELTPKVKAEEAKVTFDVTSLELTIEQSWRCSDSKDDVTYKASASRSVLFTCSGGREGERMVCTPKNCTGSASPHVRRPRAGDRHLLTSSTTTTYPIAKHEDCDNLPSAFAGWQITRMNFWEGVQASQTVPSASLSLDLRNLNDGSLTTCRLFADNVDEEAGVTLANKGATLGQGTDNYDNGCGTGWFELEDDRGGVRQRWAWYPTANVTFDTATHELEITQNWPCGGVAGAFEAYVVQKIALDCTPLEGSLFPTGCTARRRWSISRARR